MFGFLKDKLKKLIHKKSEEIVEESKKEEKIKIDAKPEIREAPASIKESIREFESEEKKEEREEKIKELEKEEKEEEREEKKQGFFSRLAKGFSSMKLSENSFEEFFKELEEVLIENNVALEAIDTIKLGLKKELLGKEINKKEIEEKIKEALKKSMLELMIDPFNLEDKIKNSLKEKRPFVIVFFGINGSGKTTSVSKVAWHLKKHFSVVLAAADTFRAASIEQIEKHADKLKIPIIKSTYGADPASVIFDAIKHAKAKNIDIVLADTAGRMHTKSDLLREMEKIVRVSKPDLKVFVAESITGNDAIEQARAFNDAVGIDAIILSKADVDERGGTCLSVSHVTGKPILYLGMGQEYKDLEVFNKKKVVDKIFG